MTDKQLKKLNRSELLELMLEQSREIDRLQEELEETRAALTERNLKIDSCGSIAEAAAEVNYLFQSAQKAADMYLLNVQRICAEKAEEAGKAEAWEAAMRGMDPSAVRKPAVTKPAVTKPAVTKPDKEADPDNETKKDKESEAEKKDE